MVQTSWAWNRAFEKQIVPETFVEICMGVIDTAATNGASISTFNENSRISNKATVLGLNENTSPKNYAILEENRWVLDGSKTIRYNEDTVDTGFVGDSPESSNNNWYVQFNLPEATTAIIPGLTVVWDSEYGEKPSQFVIAMQNTETGHRYEIVVTNDVISSTYEYVPDGDNRTPDIELEQSDVGVMKFMGEFSDYNAVQVLILGWNTPNHRPRMDRFVFGYNWVFDKKDLLSYTHEQSGDILGLELPKNSITFSIDNSDGRWNPNNPEGLGKYIIDRQMLTVRYGVDIGHDAYGLGSIEWIPAGVFYLSEWDAPANGLEATFTARDPFEFMIDQMYYDGVTYGDHTEFIESALSMCSFPNELQTNIDLYHPYSKIALPDDKVDRYGYSGYTVAAVIQGCANASGSLCYFDRNGVFNAVGISTLREVKSFFEIPEDLAYSHPEVILNKPIKFVEISYYPIWLSEEKCNFMRYAVPRLDDPMESVTEGETIRITNDFIQYNVSAGTAYGSMQPIVKHRRQVTGEFRANPCLDLFDWVNIHSKYGEMKMMLTRIKYTYNGCFRAEYTAREMDYEEVTE